MYMSSKYNLSNKKREIHKSMFRGHAALQSSGGGSCTQVPRVGPTGCARHPNLPKQPTGLVAEHRSVH